MTAMETVRARKQGNALVVTLPNKYGVQEGQEFYISHEANGSFVLISKIKDFFANVKPGEFIDDDDDISRNLTPRGGELDD